MVAAVWAFAVVDTIVPIDGHQRIIRDLAQRNIRLFSVGGYNCIHQSKRSDCSNHGGLITYVDNNYEVERINIKMTHRYGITYSSP